MSYEIKQIEKMHTENYGNGIINTVTETRYIIVDSETGEVLDDAQGYGYKTQQGAISAYNYKNQSDEYRESFYKEAESIQKWADTHRPFIEALDDITLQFAKHQFSPDIKFDANMISEIASRYNVKLPIPSGKFLKYYQHGFYKKLTRQARKKKK